jgi:hypothetical protein
MVSGIFLNVSSAMQKRSPVFRQRREGFPYHPFVSATIGTEDPNAAIGMGLRAFDMSPT